jgi:ribosomal protein L7/L12
MLLDHSEQATGPADILGPPAPNERIAPVSAYNELQLSSFVDQIFKRLEAIEGQLVVLSEKAGVPYERPGAAAPEEVRLLVQSGDRMGAIKKYRELTGGSLEEAQAVIAEL